MLVEINHKHAYDVSSRFPFTNFMSYGNFGKEIPTKNAKNSGPLNDAEIHFGIVPQNSMKYSRVLVVNEVSWGIVEAKYFSSSNCSGSKHIGDPISSHENAAKAHDGNSQTFWSTEDKIQKMAYVGLKREESDVLRSVHIQLTQSTSDVARMRIQVSADGTLWTTAGIVDDISPYKGQGGYCFDISPKSERHFTITKVVMKPDPLYTQFVCSSVMLAYEDSNGIWNTVATKMNSSVATTMEINVFSDKWKLHSFESTEQWCRMKIYVYGRELGAKWSRCTYDECVSSHVDGSPYYTTARQACMLGCDIAAFGSGRAPDGSEIFACNDVIALFGKANVFNYHACVNSMRRFFGMSFRPFDAESENSYSLLVRAKDSSGSDSTQDVTITITDVDETPSFSNCVRYVKENTRNGDAVGPPVTASDFDRGTYGLLEYTILEEKQFSRTNLLWATVKGSFSIAPSSGQISVAKATIDYESVKEYSILVRATDKGNLDTTATVTIFVEDINESPVFPHIISNSCPYSWLMK
jgi:hypothetical protein